MPMRGCNFDHARFWWRRMWADVHSFGQKQRAINSSIMLPSPFPLGKNNPFLVGGIPTPLKNMSSSVGIIIPNIFQKKRPRPCDQFQMVPNVRNPRAHAMAHVSQQHQGLKNDGTAVHSCDWDRIPSTHILLLLLPIRPSQIPDLFLWGGPKRVYNTQRGMGLSLVIGMFRNEEPPSWDSFPTRFLSRDSRLDYLNRWEYWW